MRYDAVLFFESAAVGGLSVEGGNPTRVESNIQAATLDRRLRDLWSSHPRMVMIPHSTSFVEKVMRGLRAMESLVGEFSA